jgi:Domain of unknown function (DUF4271)
VARYLILFFSFLFIFCSSHAQTVGDSTAKDSIIQRVDSVAKDSVARVHLRRKKIIRDSTAAALIQKKIADDADSALLTVSVPVPTVNPELATAGRYVSTTPFKISLLDNPDFNFMGRGEPQTIEIHTVNSYDSIFYLLVGILFYFAFFKVLFGKYLRNLFTLFFLVSMRQQQIREQVLQSPLPSLMLNIFFVITGGLYIAYLIRFYQLAQNTDFWLLFINGVAILSLLYLCKFLFLKFSGWIFKISRATDMYIFIIFLTNKIMGIFLLPFLLILSFSGHIWREISITASLIMIGILFAYRFIVSFNPVRKEIKVRGIHFLLYLCAFELAPLLLIYKVLLSYLEKAY